MDLFDNVLKCYDESERLLIESKNRLGLENNNDYDLRKIAQENESNDLITKYQSLIRIINIKRTNADNSYNRHSECLREKCLRRKDGT